MGQIAKAAAFCAALAFIAAMVITGHESWAAVGFFVLLFI